MKKIEYLVTRIGGVEPPTPLLENVNNSFALSVGNNVWYFYNKDNYIFCRRIINGVLEETDVRVCQGIRPIALYNPPNVYLFFERDYKIFVKIISENATQQQMIENDQQDNLITQPFRKYNYDATNFSFSLFEKDKLETDIIDSDTFSVSGISYSYVSEEPFAIIFINASSASFLYKNKEINSIYGMLIYIDELGNVIPIWPERKKIEKDVDFFMPPLPRRKYSIIYYPDLTTTNIYQIHYNIYEPHVPVSPPNTFREVKIKYSYSLYERDVYNDFSITENYNFLKQIYNEPNINYTYSLYERDVYNDFSITENYNFLKQIYNEPNINYTYSLYERDVYNDFSAFPKILEINIIKTSNENFINNENVTFIRNGDTISSGVLIKKDNEDMLYVSLDSGQPTIGDLILGATSGATGIVFKIIELSVL